ncbi:MAG: phospholipase D-like domain-containing protein [Chloroflexota bacterium]|nr:phospholipase D-like domain-containing protein [Chloroflexota bacterium]
MVRRLAGLAGFVILVLAVTWLIRSAPLSDWLDDEGGSSLPGPVATALAAGEANTAGDGDVTGSRSLIVLPDDGQNAILSELEAATESIDLYIYLLPSDEVIDRLEAAHDRGVRVRVILEQDPFGGGNSNAEAFEALERAGIYVRWSSERFRFSHIKAIVIDGRVALIMTLNLSRTALNGNREFAVLSTRPGDVHELSMLFEADWSGESYSPSGSMVTSPDNSVAVLRELISSAEQTIEIYAEVVRDEGIRQDLIAATNRDVTVKILVPTSPSSDDMLIYRELEASGAQVKLLTRNYSHAKAIIIDSTVAFVGSQNLTSTSLNDNREAGIVLDDASNVGRLVGVFREDWESSADVD